MSRPVRSTPFITTVSLLLLAGGCGAGSDSARIEPPPLPTYEGRVIVGFERTEFHPCGTRLTDPGWWVTGGERIQRYIDESARPPINGLRTLFVEVEGQLTEPGSYGRNGEYTRQLTITRTYTILDIDAGADGCLN